MGMAADREPPPRACGCPSCKAEVEVAISFLAELGEEEIIDTETAAELDRARAEQGGDVPVEEVRRRLGL